MAASISIATGAAQGLLSQASKAASGWDPIGSWAANNISKDLNKTILFPINTGASAISPEAAKTLQGLQQDSKQTVENDPVLSWVGQTANSVGLAVDDGIRSLGINPDSLKMAIAGYFAPYAVPLLQAAMVKAKGGTWEDAALGAVASYAAGAVGQYAGNWVGTNLTGSAVTSSQVAQQMGISAASQEAAKIAAQNAASLGWAGTAANQFATQLTKAGVSNLTGQLITTGQVDLNKVLDTMKSSGITAGTALLTSQIPGFSTLSKDAQSSINKAVASSLQGKDLSSVGISLAMDTAVNGMKGYMSDALTGAQDLYNTAVGKFNDAVDFFTGKESTAQGTYAQLSDIKTQYDSKVSQYNDLVKQYNTSGSPEIKAQLDALKPQLEALQTQWDPLYSSYQSQYNDYTSAQTQLNDSMQSIIDSRRGYFDQALQSINPNADMEAYVALNPDVQAEISSTGKSAAQIYVERQMANPDSVQEATWGQAISQADPTNLNSVSQLYKQATGSSLGSSTVDPNTLSIYQDKVQGSADWYLSEADKAKIAGDFTKYTQLMNEYNSLYSGAYGTSAGFGSTGNSLADTTSGSFVSSVLNALKTQGKLPSTSIASSYQGTKPTASPASAKVTSYGFGNLNPYLSDLMTVTPGSNQYLRSKYTYDPNAVNQRLSNISGMDLSGQSQDVINAFKQAMPDAVMSGNYMFLPSNVQSTIANQFSSLGTSGYNSVINNTNALDYLKSGAVGGLGSYLQSYSNPYSIGVGNSTNTGGLSQVAANWAGSSGVSNPATRSLLAKNLTS